MKRVLVVFALAVVSAASLYAQESAPPAPDNAVVASVNGEIITADQLDRLWNRMGSKMRAQYEKTGNGKVRFLENYVGKRLLLQLAAESEFEKSPEVQAELEAAREAALFDLYVREVIASQIVTEATVKKFYDDHPNDFMHPASVKVRIITIGTEKRSPDAARALIGDLMKELYGVRVGSGNNARAISDAFAEAARKSSEHPSAASGGDLGWVGRDGLEPKIADAVFNMSPNAISGILETDKGLSLALVEDRQDASKQSYESARPMIREYLIGANTSKVVEALNRTQRELRASSKVSVYPQNVK